MTGTNAGLMMPSSETAECAMEIIGSRQEKTLKDWFTHFYDGWFSSKRFGEAMMRGIANEEVVVAALHALPFVEDVFEAGVLFRKDARHPNSPALRHANPSSKRLVWNVSVPLLVLMQFQFLVRIIILYCHSLNQNECGCTIAR